ncbi:MAG: beta-glucosidase BglX [Candidatus Pristimantibacillus lignocellulolyticus]|uniref:beta-glucosidase n=1 Tax=Candidatus Pristimantibacillus lignocellulolyticus TaxID=2994561 RepID=A0A9J6Z911_9BACL|nr:MAG: beta-glucosidase BglX [Candidatus Pristimantibacillus lignocellulolyticus]
MVAKKNLFSLEIKEKVQSLISQMTIEEKVGQMSQFDWGFHAINPDAGGEINEIMKDLLNKGMLGSLFNLSGVEQSNTIQQQSIERSRLGIPMIVGRDVIHGYRSVFPIPLAQSASWNPDLIRRTAEVASKEAASDGISWVFAPMIDITRDPRWGRIAETMGEDPHLSEIMAEAWVDGTEVQDSTNESLSVASCPKHYAGYGFAESGRDYNTVDVSDRVLREVILPPFRKAVEAGALSIMASFNEMNGIPACANRYLLTTILREEWGFEGVLVSDYNALGELITHGVAKDAEEACEIAIKAGTDMDMHSGIYYKYLPKLVKEGRIEESLIDSAVGRILALKMKLGLFDNAQVNPALNENIILSEEHVSLAREAARESIVLLKNDNRTLPLTKQLKTLAVIGPLATNTTDPLGCWAADGNPDDVVSLLDGIKAKISPDTELLYAEGCGIESEVENGFEQALAAVAKADVTIIAVGEGKTMSGEGNSRSELDLPGKQRKLVEEAIKLGKPVIVVLFNGRPLTTVWLDETATAIVEAWHLGIQSGNAIADVLFGDYNPSGKLTATFPQSVGQIPLYYYRKNTGRPPGGVYSSRYIDAPVQALYPFGYGLSYTDFEYSNLVLSSTHISNSDSVSVSVDVKNTGNYSGEEVVQLYIRDVAASVTQPLKKLKGFTKVSLAVGEMKTVTFTVSPSDLSIIAADNNLTVEAGSFQVIVGPNSEAGLIGEIVVQ